MTEGTCTKCGVTSSGGSFCSECGASLNAQPELRPATVNDVPNAQRWNFARLVAAGIGVWQFGSAGSELSGFYGVTPVDEATWMLFGLATVAVCIGYPPFSRDANPKKLATLALTLIVLSFPVRLILAQTFAAPYK